MITCNANSPFVNLVQVFTLARVKQVSNRPVSLNVIEVLRQFGVARDIILTDMAAIPKMHADRAKHFADSMIITDSKYILT